MKKDEEMKEVNKKQEYKNDTSKEGWGFGRIFGSK